MDKDQITILWNSYKWVFIFIYCFEIGNWSFMFQLQGMLKRKLVYFKIKIIFSWDLRKCYKKVAMTALHTPLFSAF